MAHGVKGDEPRKTQMRERVFLMLLILTASVILNRASLLYEGVNSTVSSVWPTQVIFGFYFAILVLCVQGLQLRLNSTHHPTPNQRLLLLVLICLCSDLVTVNYQEATKDEPAFYGVIVLWDIAVFFIWLRCLDLAKDASETKFFSFSLVAVAPFLKLGREILLLPYAKWNLNSCHEDLIGPYLDLLFGDLTVCTWIVIALHRSNGFRKKRIDRLNLAAKHLVFTGCVYWILRGVRNVLDFLAPQYSAAECSWLGNRLWYLSFAYFIVALAITVAVSKKNIFGLGTYFGLPRSSSRGADQY